MLLYEYAEPALRPEDREGVISLWMRDDLQKRQRVQLQQKLDRLAQVDYDIARDWLAGTDAPGIFKLRLRGNVQVRPLCCYGPALPKAEITFLLGVTKKGGGDVKKNDLDRAGARRLQIEVDSNWRIPYEQTKEAPN